MVLVSSGTHLVKNHESVSQKRSPKLKMLGPLCNQQIIRRQKSHEQDIIPKNHLQINRSFFAFYRTHFMNYFASSGIFMHQGRRTQRKQNHVDRLSKNNKMNSFYWLGTYMALQCCWKWTKKCEIIMADYCVLDQTI